MRLVLISDTHNFQASLRLPAGDVLIHAGDLTREGRLRDVFALDDFLARQPHRHKIVIAGNHDFCFERRRAASQAALKHAVYLQDAAVTLEGLKFYGSPWQPWFMDWAFNLPRGPALRARWEQIPPDTDVLITHGPPLGLGDLTERGERAGCADLRAVVDRLQPRLHVFGHIHEGYGRYPGPRTLSINASICNLDYEPVNPPLVVDL